MRDAPADRRALIRQGVTWNTLHQVFQAAISFAAMVLLVRVIPPSDYGRVGVVVGFLTLLNTVNCGVFMAQALQLPDGVEPDWSQHWSAGFYIQMALGVACESWAGVCWCLDDYRPVAPLLHLAGVGLMLDTANKLGLTMLRREMEFRRLRIVSGLGALLSLTVTVALAVEGGGAYAMVLGGNVVGALPFTVDLLLIRGWRPRSGWWRWPDWERYRPAIRFGLQQAGSGALGAARGVLEAAVLPALLGYTGIGLLNRAQALFNVSVGRLVSVLAETVYPLLPRYAADPRRFRERATLFVRVLLLVLFPGALYLGIEGRALSRLLYGEKWTAADPLIWPGAVAGFGFATFLVSGNVLLAVNRLRACLLLNFMMAVLAVPMVVTAWGTRDLLTYAWAIAVGQIVGGGIALATASSFLSDRWIRETLVPPLVSSALAVMAVLAVRVALREPLLAVRLSITVLVFLATTALALRVLFPASLAEVLTHMPGGSRLRSWSLLVSSTQPSEVDWVPVQDHREEA